MNLNFSAFGPPESLNSSPSVSSGLRDGGTHVAGLPTAATGGSSLMPENEPYPSSESGFVLPTPPQNNLVPNEAETTAVSSRSTVRLVGMAALGVLGTLMSALVLWLSRGATAPTGAFLLLALCGLASAGSCITALKHAGESWITRTRIGWSSIAIACVLYALGCIAYAYLRRSGPVPVPSLADWFWMGGQPFLWVGLFLLAWRGKSMGLMRLFTDTLIVMLAAMVLLWSLVLQEKLFDANMTLFAKSVLVYYPMWDIAHLFCVLMLLANLRDRPALARASWFLFGGVISLIASDALSSLLSSVNGHHPLWLDGLQGWSVLLIGMAALVNAYTPHHADAPPLSGAEEAVDAAPRGATSIKAAGLDEALARWHRSAMLWLPYLATLSVSCILIGREFFGSDSQGVQHLMPVLALLLAIAARQMLTLWDNLQLAERLRASNADLEQNVNERTRHLATLHGITSTLNTSLDRRTILRVTLERIITATGAEAGGIWLREVRRDVYEGNAPHDEWTLMHWQGTTDAAMPSLLRDLSIAEAAEGEGMSHETFHLSPATREAMQTGIAPQRQRLILVPVRWQGQLLGVMGLMRQNGAFSYEDRALVESVALEAGAALQNARMYSEAAHRADRDSVTDLFNHRAVQEQMTATLSRCKRSGGVFSIVMMDLNNFKFFNDTYGHPVGDDVLRTVARGLRESCRGSDILGRYGGDEFIVVLPDTDAARTLDVCGRIKATLDAKHFEPVPGTRLPIGTAFGWAAFPGDGETIMDLLSAADANLYNHKRGGASYLSQSQKALQEGRDEMKKLKNRSHGGSFGVLDALVTAIDNKDHYTRQHSEEVTYLSLLVARELDYSREQLEAVRISGLLHDVGKIAVPDQILRHPGKLGRDEWDIMQQHPVFGALIVKDVPHLERVIDGIKYHHEKWDGSGYPEKRVGEDIPEMGRLLAMGDCYSALTTDRPYRKGWTPDAALEEIERCAGSHFDPRLCAIFLQVMRRALAQGVDSQDYGTRIAEDFGAELEVAAAAPVGS
ncbi:cyclic di-GMP phosphodiesterase response regulator RpfG [Abditibacteriota bacterium]|nr:cyclic di-GMP phosphodiesterase response regulator RpfG [Abditibacteriota bacterium]